MKFHSPIPRGSWLRRVRRLLSPGSLTVATLLLLVASVIPAGAQTVGGRAEIFAGSELESYLRYLQTLGKSRPGVWAIRPLSPVQIDKLMPTDSAHPWAQRYELSVTKRTGFTYDFVRPTSGVIANTSYPFGGNDGPIWAGKGLTGWAQAGVQLRWGPISGSLAPIAFRAANSDFPLMDNGKTGALAFGDGQFPTAIDRPQRFGSGSYSRIDLGESTLRIDGVGLTAGISTASQWWGPTVEFPYVLGNNAGGFPHVFLGTSRPVNIGFGTAHGQIHYGYLYQSPFSAVTGKRYFESVEHPGRVRFMAGVIGALQIRGVPGLELGGARFFHTRTDSSGLSSEDLSLPWQNLLKTHLPAQSDTAILGDVRSVFENQLGSLFLRWAPPGSGFEFYSEFGREDFNANLRDVMLNPDHASTLNVGFRKAWLRKDRMTALRAEFFNYEAPSSGRARGEGSIYLHQPLLQGHTYRGQVLGADVGAGAGAAYLLAFERYSPSGKWKILTSRVTQREIPFATSVWPADEPLSRPVDVQNSVGAEMTRFVGPFDITGRIVLTSELNRYFLSDKSNANFGLSIRQGF